MSLFIGNDDNNDGIFHVTTGYRTKEELRSGILSDTVFHNFLPFQDWDIYPISYGYGDSSMNHHLYLGASPVIVKEPARVFSFSGISNSSLWSIYNNDSSNLIFLNSSKNVVNSNLVWAKYDGNDTQFYTTINDDYWNNASWPITYMTSGTTSTNVAYVVVLRNSTPRFGSGVTIGGGDIKIGNNSLLNFKYVYNFGTLNNHPSSIQINSGSQLIDASQIQGSLTIDATGGGEIEILKGGYPIIKASSTFGYPIETKTENVPNGSYFNWLFTDGEAISIEWKTVSNTTYEGKVFLYFSNGKVYGYGYQVNPPFLDGYVTQRILTESNKIKVESEVYTGPPSYNYFDYYTELTVTRYSG